MVSQRWGALVGKVRVGMGDGRDAVFESVPLAVDGRAAVSPDPTEKPRLSEGGLFLFGFGGDGAVAVGGGRGGADAEEVFELLREVAAVFGFGG